MTRVLSVRLVDELYDRVQQQPVSPREVITEALHQYFRYRDEFKTKDIDEKENIPKINVHLGTHLPDGSVVIDKDSEYLSLEMEVKGLKKEIDHKMEIIKIKDNIIFELRRDKTLSERREWTLRQYFLPPRISFLKSLTPSGRKAIKAQEEINEIERESLITPSNPVNVYDVEE